MTLSMIFSDREGETYFLPSSVEYKSRRYSDTGKVTLTTDVFIERPIDERKHLCARIHCCIVAL